MLSRLYPIILQAWLTLPSCLASSNTPTFARMTFCSCVMVASPVRDAAGQRGSASSGERSRSPRSSIPTSPNHSVRLSRDFYSFWLRLPLKEFVELGGLLSYGANIRDLLRRGATCVDKI